MIEKTNENKESSIVVQPNAAISEPIVVTPLASKETPRPTTPNKQATASSPTSPNQVSDYSSQAKNVEVESGRANGTGEGSAGEDEDEEGFVDGMPEDLAEYIEDIWEFLVGASGSEDWDRAMKLWAKLEKRMGYPQGRVSELFSSDDQNTSH